MGLAINTVAAEKAFGGPLPDSWSLLFDPAQSARLASCGISVLDARDEVLSALLIYQGRSLARSAPSQIKRAGELLNQLRPNLRYVDSERYIDDLASGKLCVAFAYIGDTLSAKKAGQPVKFVVPQEGSTLFIDSLVIPKNAARPDLAYRFIDYLLQPKVAALISAETFYASGNARELLDTAAQLELYPDRETTRRLVALELLPEKLTPTLERIWQRFVTGQ